MNGVLEVGRRVVLVLGSFLLIASSEAAEKQDGCSFEYVTGDRRLTAGYVDATEEASANHTSWNLLKQALPNLRKVFVTPNGNQVLLIGWHSLPTDFSKYSRFQALSNLETAWERGKRTVLAGKDTRSQEASGTPVSLLGTINYVDAGKPFRDAFADVIATKDCIFSMKLTAEREPDDDAVWSDFANRVERARRLLEEHEGPVNYSADGTYFSAAGMANIGLLIGLACLIGGVAAFGLTRRYRVVPGKESLRYSIAIVLLCSLVLALLIYKASVLGAMYSTYDSALVIFVPLALHLSAWWFRTPRTVLIAISYMIGIFAADMIYLALGWTALPRAGSLVSLVIGLGLLSYALVGSLRALQPGTELVSK